MSLNSELRKVEVELEEEEKVCKAATEERNNIQEQLRQKTLLLEGLDMERDALLRSLVEARDNVKLEMQSLEKEARELKERHTQLTETLVARESESKRLRKEIASLDAALAKELQAVKMLEAIKSGKGSEDDSVLREKEEVSQKINTITEKTNVAKEMIDKVSSETEIVGEQIRSNKQLIKEIESRVVVLNDQHVQLKSQVSEKKQETDRLIREAASTETKRAETTSLIEEKEHYLNHTVLRELKEVSRALSHVGSKLQVSRKEESDRKMNLKDSERCLEEKLSALKHARTQTEFLTHKIASETDTIAKLNRDLAEVMKANSAMKARNKSKDLETIRSENAELELEVEKMQAEIQFMKIHNMLGEDGRLKPLQIESVESENDMSAALVTKLGINEFLIQAQSEPEVHKTHLMLVEKISHILELIHGAETLEAQYQSDAERSREMIKQLTDKNADIFKEIDHIQNFADHALVQLGLNQLRSSTSPERSKVLLLTGLGFTDSDMQKLLDALQPSEKAKLESIVINNNKLVAFNLTQLIIDCIELRFLDVRGNPDIESLNELERFLRNKVEGITSVFRDGKVIIANSGQQVRLTVSHGEAYD